MAGLTKLSGHAIAALVCVAVWVLGLLWMWLDFNYGSHVWVITPGPIIMMIAMAAAIPTFVFCVIVLLGRKTRERTLRRPGDPQSR